MKNKLTQKELKKILHYDPNTGIFTWKKKPIRYIEIGTVAGSQMKGGYIYIGINKKVYSAHRLAWLYMEGYWPEHDIDHINRIKDDNAWDNLRQINKQCNARNQKISKNNKSGVTGIYRQKKSNRWASQIKINDRQIYLGSYKSLTKAVYHRWKAEVKYGFPNCNSTSTAYLYLKERGLIKKLLKSKE